MLSDDGIHRTPWMLVTRDPKMVKEQKDTDRGKRVRSEFKEALKKWNITEDRIIHVTSKESILLNLQRFTSNSWLILTFQKMTLFYMMDLNAFKRQTIVIFDNLGLKIHIEYPINVHRFLSPNGNKLHGCKSI